MKIYKRIKPLENYSYDISDVYHEFWDYSDEIINNYSIDKLSNIDWDDLYQSKIIFSKQ